MLVNIVVWVLFGLMAGVIARLLYHGYDWMGWPGTFLLGIAGSLLGGGVAYYLGYDPSPIGKAGLILTTFGAAALLAIGGFTGRTRRTA